MIFSSLIFLFLFLPLTLLGYYLIRPAYRNGFLLLASLIFFAWGGVSYTLILIAVILFNYFISWLVQRLRGTPKGYRWLAVGVAVNILVLAFFKYTVFALENINFLRLQLGAARFPLPKIVLPVGISFYIFHCISYLVDIYRRKSDAQRNILDLSLYICMFSQLVAGPIIRYSDVWMQLRHRDHHLAKFSSGVERFIIGMAKKVLLANTFGYTADQFFNSDLTQLSAINAWLGLICYTLQIYYDFAGYSDMAIGLGRMFGFEFMENFNFPYIARSVKEFWRRWHISLSTFFRDYVYIPLGGNRVAVSRMYVNLLLVFFLTGFWHGASWNFVIWGLFHGFFLVMERLFLERWLQRAGRPLANIYTLLVVMLAWVLFRAETLGQALQYGEALIRFRTTTLDIALLRESLRPDLLLVMATGIAGAFGFFPWLKRVTAGWLNGEGTGNRALEYTYHTMSALIGVALMFLCTLYLLADTYNPFIYYRF